LLLHTEVCMEFWPDPDWYICTPQGWEVVGVAQTCLESEYSCGWAQCDMSNWWNTLTWANSTCTFEPYIDNPDDKLSCISSYAPDWAPWYTFFWAWTYYSNKCIDDDGHLCTSDWTNYATWFDSYCLMGDLNCPDVPTELFDASISCVWTIDLDPSCIDDNVCTSDACGWVNVASCLNEPLPAGTIIDNICCDGNSNEIEIGDEPAIECYETATYDPSTCSYVITNDEDPEPTDLPCGQIAEFDADDTCERII